MEKTCQFRNIFGSPRMGIHSYRIFDVAIVDVIGTVLMAWGISTVTPWGFGFVLIALLVLGHILHNLFCVETKGVKLQRQLLTSM